MLSVPDQCFAANSAIESGSTLASLEPPPRDALSWEGTAEGATTGGFGATAGASAFRRFAAGALAGDDGFSSFFAAPPFSVAALPFPVFAFPLSTGDSVSMGVGSGSVLGSGSIAAAPRLPLAAGFAAGDFAGFAVWAFAGLAGDLDFGKGSGSAAGFGACSGASPPKSPCFSRATSAALSPSCSRPNLLSSSLSLGTVRESGSSALAAPGLFLGGIVRERSKHGSIQPASVPLVSPTSRDRCELCQAPRAKSRVLRRHRL
mmetsp:Transcript_13930/g.46127  ORF Transcript_13930/g.46127 Transcript_13930/m.46127 type:complete len:261 (-) Transcript_13930:21-803(-)